MKLQYLIRKINEDNYLLIRAGRVVAYRLKEGIGERLDDWPTEIALGILKKWDFRKKKQYRLSPRSQYLVIVVNQRKTRRRVRKG